MVETQLCKLRDSSGSFVLSFAYDMRGVCESELQLVVLIVDIDAQVRKLSVGCSRPVPYVFILHSPHDRPVAPLDGQ